MLKMLAGITSPTEGPANASGRLLQLLEVGTGFHPELTGRENIYLNGAILGMTRRHRPASTKLSISQKSPNSSIHQSSATRPGCTCAWPSPSPPPRTRILVVDEVLAVGDAEFQRNASAGWPERAAKARTADLRQPRPRDAEPDLSAVHLDGLRDDPRLSPTTSIIRDYLTASLRSQDADGRLAETGVVTVHTLRVLPAGEHGGSLLMRGDQLRLELEFDVTQNLRARLWRSS